MKSNGYHKNIFPANKIRTGQNFFSTRRREKQYLGDFRFAETSKYPGISQKDKISNFGMFGYFGLEEFPDKISQLTFSGIPVLCAAG